MRFSLGLVTIASLGLLVGMGGCSSTKGGTSSDAAKVNFLGDGAQEYWVRGTGTITLDESASSASPADRLDLARALATEKQLAIGWFLNTYVQAKEEDDPNVDYGGFDGQVRFGTGGASDVTLTSGLTYTFPFQFDVGGTGDFIKRVAGPTATGTTAPFTLKLGKVSNADLARLDQGKEWYRDDQWAAWTPKGLPETSIEGQPVIIEVEPQSQDAFLPIDQLAATGHIGIAIHFGFDNEGDPGSPPGRFDVDLAGKLYASLLAKGFVSPASAYATYDATANGPLTKGITVNGKDVSVDVSLYHAGDSTKGVAGPDPETDAGGEALTTAMRGSLTNSQVIVYVGHSGTLYGFALADWKKTDKGSIEFGELSSLPMPPSFQLVVAEGCQTYSMADAFWKNPAKADHQSLNVVTSLGLTDADSINTVEKVVDALTAQSAGRAVSPRVSDLLNSFRPAEGSGFKPLYGLHGIDSDPHSDPLADPSVLNKACRTRDDCRGLDGNDCVSGSDGMSVCSMGCTADDGCPAEYKCKAAVETLLGGSPGQCIANQP